MKCYALSSGIYIDKGFLLWFGLCANHTMRTLDIGVCGLLLGDIITVPKLWDL